VALVAEDEGEAVGTVYANLSSPHFGFAFGLYTRPTARRRGIGHGLMRAIAAVIATMASNTSSSPSTRRTSRRELSTTGGFVDHARTLRAEVDDLLGG
jgi:GNAT superfamily N-acetyltransferase